METIIFEEKESAKAIDLPTLKRTLSLAEFSGRLPRTKPVEHHQFIDRIADMTDKKGYAFEMDPIYVSKNESKRIMALDPEKKGLVESFLFQRLVTRLKLTGADFNTNELQTTIAIGYTDKGLQVAFGTNVSICQNMCIFSNRIMTTYGSSSMPFEKMMELIEKHILDLPAIKENDFMILSQMKKIKLEQSQVIETIGDIYLNSVKNAYFGGNSPMKMGQVSTFTQGLINEVPALRDVSKSGKTNLYDLYNGGTRILHPAKVNDVSNLWPDVAQWGDYLTDRFKLSLN